MKKEPFAYAELKLRGFLLFWNRHEIPNNIRYSQTGAKIPLLNALFFLGFWPVVSLGLAAMFLSFSKALRSPRMAFLILFVFGYCFITFMFHVLARYRLPVLPFLCGFAGLAVHYILLNWPRKKYLLKTLLLLIVCLLFVGQGFQFYSKNLEKHFISFARPDGVQVKLGKIWKISDNGPEGFGGWSYEKIKSRLVLKKKFHIPKGVETFPKRSLRICIFSENGGKVEISAGESMQKLSTVIINLKKGNNFCRLNLKQPDKVVTDPELIISVLPIDKPCGVGFDLQRFYKRTKVLLTKDGKTREQVLPELIASIFIEIPD